MGILSEVKTKLCQNTHKNGVLNNLSSFESITLIFFLVYFSFHSLQNISYQKKRKRKLREIEERKLAVRNGEIEFDDMNDIELMETYTRFILTASLKNANNSFSNLSLEDFSQKMKGVERSRERLLQAIAESKRILERVNQQDSGIEAADTDAFLEELRAKERAAEEKRNNSVSERHNRELEQQRQEAERESSEVISDEEEV